MSNGHVHERDSITIAVAGVIVGTAITGNFAVAGFFSLGAISGIFLTPDLDIDTWILSKRKLVNRFKVLGYLWLAYWYPYSIAIPHRHWASHLPVISTALRVLYLGLIPLVFAIMVRPTIDIGDVVWFALWFGGLAVSDLAHWLRDTL